MQKQKGYFSVIFFFNIVVGLESMKAFICFFRPFLFFFFFYGFFHFKLGAQMFFMESSERRL